MAHPDLETLIESSGAFQLRMLEALGSHVRQCAAQADATGRAVVGDFTVGDEDRSEPLLRIRFVCEPGGESRVISVDRHEKTLH